MSTPEHRRPLAPRRAGFALATGAVAILLVWALIDAVGDPDVASGVLVGGGAVLVVAAIGLRRASRRPDRTGTASRALVGQKDERDTAIVSGAFTVTGRVATIAVAAATVAVAVGADPLVMLRVVTFTVYVVLIGAFVVLSRRT